MRMMMTVQIPTEAGNRAIKDGSLPKVMGQFMEAYRPEAAYFITRDGERCAVFVFDMKDGAQMPPIAEPFFFALNARVEYCPAMNAEDLKSGLGSVKC
ncbi:MAG: hypothetical protein HYX75_04425 [Acidobacteria bacterium]|nr:hypothetical protein [Acidobacteriota bacterium]